MRTIIALLRLIFVEGTPTSILLLEEGSDGDKNAEDGTTATTMPKVRGKNFIFGG